MPTDFFQDEGDMLEWLIIAILLYEVFQHRSRFEALERETKQLHDLIAKLRARPEPPAGADAGPARVAPPAAVSPVRVPTAALQRPHVAPPAPPKPVAASEIPDEPARPPRAVNWPMPGAVPAARATAAPSPTAAAQTPPAPPRAPARPPAPPVPPAEPTAPFDWEKLIGVKLFSWIAGAALLIAGVLFLRYSLDSGWLRPEIRMAIGFIVGIALLVVCEMKIARSYAQTANAMDAAGIGLLFATVFASFALWHLIPPVAATALLIMITGVAVLLSIRRDSMFIALLGLLGGFSTPVLLSTGQDNPIGLFGYLLLLNAGLAWVAYKKRWPLLTALSLVFSTLYQWGWVGKFLTPEKLPIAVGIFLAFPALALIALALGNSGYAHDYKDDEERPLFAHALFAQAASVSAALPLFFAVYLATVPAYGNHFGVLFGFLFCVAAGLFVVSVTQGPRALHTLGAASVVTVFALWFQSSYAAAAYPAILAFVALFAGLYLVAPTLAQRWRGVSLDGIGAYAALAAPLLLFTFPVLLGMEPRTAAPWLPFGVLFALMAGCATYAIVHRNGLVHYVAAFFALAAEAAWSARYLDAAHLYSGLGLYALFGLFYVGVPYAARRYERPLAPRAAAGVLTLASLALLFFVAAGPAAASALWGLALLIAVLNVGLYLESATGKMPVLSVVGSLLSWAILATWWMVAEASAIVPALVVMGGFAMLTMVGGAWARHNAGGDNDAVAGFDANVFLGLVGHLFVAFVATRPELSIPPWPIFGALLVLDLACLAVSLYMRAGLIHAVATGATAVILMLWVNVGTLAPWPATGVVAAGAFALIAFAGLWLARRVGAKARGFQVAAGLAVVLGQVVAVFAQGQNGSPSLYFLLAAQLIFIAGALSLSWVDAEELGWFGVASVVPAAIAGGLWQLYHPAPADWSSELLFITPVLLAFAAYPLVLGRRAGDARTPYLATVLANVAYFFLARAAIMRGGYGGYIGALPIAQALLLVPVLSQLVRFERERASRAPRGQPYMASDRLAIVAAATLACVTVAIPLQLDKNWITIGWALEGAGLLWLVLRIRHAGLFAAGVGLLGVAFVRLTLNPAVLSYHPRGAMPIFNWYLYTYALVAGMLFLAAQLVRGGDAVARKISALFSAGGAVLMFLLLNIEIADFYATGPTITFHFSANLAQDLTYTIGWALFALSLLAAGIVMRSKQSRIASIGLLVVTVLKCFLHDFGRLGGLYRVGSFVGLALSLALVAIVLQRFVLTRDEPHLEAA